MGIKKEKTYGKLSTPRPFSDYSEYSDNWDDINWDNKKKNNGKQNTNTTNGKDTNGTQTDK